MLCLTATEGRATARAAGAAATSLAAAPSYARHVPERPLLYALVQAHYPDFIAHLRKQLGKQLWEKQLDENNWTKTTGHPQLRSSSSLRECCS